MNPRMRVDGSGGWLILLALVLVVWTGTDVRASEQRLSTASDGASTSAPESEGGPVAEMTDIIDIRPPVPYGMDPRLLFLALAISMILAVIAVLYFWRRRKREPEKAAVLPRVPEDEEALDSLRDLESCEGIPDREYYFRLTGILRHYLDRRYGTDTLEKTTEELVPVLRRIESEPDLQMSLLNLLRSADPVKYASAPAGPVRRREDMAFALGFVRATRRGLEEEKPHVPV